MLHLESLNNCSPEEYALVGVHADALYKHLQYKLHLEQLVLNKKLVPALLISNVQIRKNTQSKFSQQFGKLWQALRFIN